MDGSISIKRGDRLPKKVCLLKMQLAYSMRKQRLTKKEIAEVLKLPLHAIENAVETLVRRKRIQKRRPRPNMGDLRPLKGTKFGGEAVSRYGIFFCRK